MTGRLSSWPGRARPGHFLPAFIVMALVELMIVLPFGGVLDHQRLRRDEAQRTLADVRALAARFDHPREERIQPFDGPLPAAIRSDAEAAGFAVARVDAEGDDGAVLVLDAVRFQPFFAWVAAAEQRHGLAVDRLTVRPNGDATLAVSVSLHRRGP